MGLDFVGYYLRKGETMDDIWNMSYEERNARELFYARKGWELVHALNCSTSGDCTSKLQLEDWVNLMEVISPIAPYFDEIEEAFDAYYEADDLATFRLMNPRKAQLVDLYEKWHEHNFDEEPQLGMDFSVRYMKNFWEAGDRVISYLEDPEYEVWMIASY